MKLQNVKTISYLNVQDACSFGVKNEKLEQTKEREIPIFTTIILLMTRNEIYS